MAQANISVIQGLYAAFGRGDIAAIVAALSSEVDWRVNGRSGDYPMLGTWTGPRQVQEFFKNLASHEDITEFAPREFYGAKNKVFVLGRYASKLRKTGRAVEGEWIHVFTLQGDKVAAFHEFFDTAQVVEAWRG